MKPELIIFAGPNGSGKSSFKKQLESEAYKFPPVYINADDIKLEYSCTDQEAADRADQLRLQCLQSGRPFTIETLLSTTQNTFLMKQALQAGYEILLYYVLTISPIINVHRVHNRRDKGGHFIEDDKVTERYHRSIHLLPEALYYTNRAKIYDNSSTETALIYEKHFIRFKNQPLEVPLIANNELWSIEKIKELVNPTYIDNGENAIETYKSLLIDLTKKYGGQKNISDVDNEIIYDMVNKGYRKTDIHEAIILHSPNGTNGRYAESLLKKYLY